MSLGRLEKAIAHLPKKRGADEVAILLDATGSSIDKKEGKRLQRLQVEEWKTFNPVGRRALENLTGKSAPDVKAVELKVAGRYTTGIDEQSALTFVSPQIGFVAIADDSDAIWRIPHAGTQKSGAIDSEIVREGDKLKGLEGAFYDHDGQRLLVLSEDARKLYELPATIKGGALQLGKPKALGTLGDMDQLDNKGWEGIAIYPGKFSPDGKPRLLAAHEGSPRGIGVFNLETLQMEAFIKLPKALKKELADLSDLTIDPKTGHLFLLSDESHRVVEARLSHTKPAVGGGQIDSWSLVMIGSTDLPKTGKGHPKAEGLAFDQDGNLWISTELGGNLLKLAR